MHVLFPLEDLPRRTGRSVHLEAQSTIRLHRIREKRMFKRRGFERKLSILLSFDVRDLFLSIASMPRCQLMDLLDSAVVRFDLNRQSLSQQSGGLPGKSVLVRVGNR